MTHPIISDLEKRHTAKHYDAAKRISDHDINVIYEAMRLSPSSINSQPWKFIVIESDQAKQRFHDSFANMFQFNQKHAKTASHIVLFAHKTNYTRDDYARVIDTDIKNGRTQSENREHAFGAFAFVDMNTDEQGNNATWTKAQTYISLGNTMHAAARLGIDSTPMEGVDAQLLGEIFSKELDGYVCDVALALGYHDSAEDYNAKLPKSRLDAEQVIQVL
ncbi:nitroreductase family protein [Pseudoalteromonas sp. NZS127]|uniref:nitroreductase family protein n=1 Tax=unclassified Pseudoalteromonas TaxID=194690 RepID=UPI0018CED940|nr:nitroreductase family protein [Pseudoalteromonas sp. NZS127]MBH0072467.1 nitroreductase family protein [Pseudoalteromonas sp. NZS127]